MAGHLTALKRREGTEPTAMPRLRATSPPPFYADRPGSEKANWSYRDLVGAHGINATKADAIGTER